MLSSKVDPRCGDHRSARSGIFSRGYVRSPARPAPASRSCSTRSASASAVAAISACCTSDAGRGQRPLQRRRRVIRRTPSSTNTGCRAQRTGSEPGGSSAATVARAPSSTTRRWGSACCVASARPSPRSTASTKISVCSIPASTDACSTRSPASRMRYGRPPPLGSGSRAVARAEAEQALIAARRDEFSPPRRRGNRQLAAATGEEAQPAGRRRR